MHLPDDFAEARIRSKGIQPGVNLQVGKLGLVILVTSFQLPECGVFLTERGMDPGQFVVTNLETDSRAVVRFYNKRGTAEQQIQEGKQAVKMTRLSCHRFRSSEVRLRLSVIAYNLGNLWPGRRAPSGRGRVLPKKIENWSLTSLQQRLVKPGGRLVKHARYYLADAGREPSDAAAVRQHGAADRGAGSGERVSGGVRNGELRRPRR
jgi:hypothetical protein